MICSAAPVPRRRKDEDEVRRERPGMREQEIKKYKPDLTPTNLYSKSDSDSSCDLRDIFLFERSLKMVNFVNITLMSNFKKYR